MRVRLELTALIFASLLYACGGPQTSPKSEKISEGAALPRRPVNNPFPNATEARLYVEVAYGKDGQPVFSRPTGRVLTVQQRSDFEAALFVTKRPESVSMCFIPHHFLRYFDRRGKNVGEISICFCCAGASASEQLNKLIPDGDILDADYEKLKTVIRRLGEPTDILCD